MDGRAETIEIVLEDTGIRKALRAFEWVAFDLPRLTTGVGVALLAGLAAVQLYLIFGDFGYPGGLTVYHGVLVAGSVAAAVAMVCGPRVAVAQGGWLLGDLVGVVFVVVYLISRIAGLPGAPYLSGWWDFPAGTFGLAFALAFLGVHSLVIVKVLIARPQTRDWRH